MAQKSSAFPRSHIAALLVERNTDGYPLITVAARDIRQHRHAFASIDRITDMADLGEAAVKYFQLLVRVASIHPTEYFSWHLWLLSNRATSSSACLGTHGILNASMPRLPCTVTSSKSHGDSGTALSLLNGLLYPCFPVLPVGR